MLGMVFQILSLFKAPLVIAVFVCPGAEALEGYEASLMPERFSKGTFNDLSIDLDGSEVSFAPKERGESLPPKPEPRLRLSRAWLGLLGILTLEGLSTGLAVLKEIRLRNHDPLLESLRCHLLIVRLVWLSATSGLADFVDDVLAPFLLDAFLLFVEADMLNLESGAVFFLGKNLLPVSVFVVVFLSKASTKCTQCDRNRGVRVDAASVFDFCVFLIDGCLDTWVLSQEETLPPRLPPVFFFL